MIKHQRNKNPSYTDKYKKSVNIIINLSVVRIAKQPAMIHHELDKDISFKDAYIDITSIVKVIIYLFLDKLEQTPAIHRECNKNLSFKDTGKNFVSINLYTSFLRIIKKIRRDSLWMQ